MSDRNDQQSSPQVRVVRTGMQKNIIQKEYKLKIKSEHAMQAYVYSR